MMKLDKQRWNLAGFLSGNNDEIKRERTVVAGSTHSHTHQMTFEGSSASPNCRFPGPSICASDEEEGEVDNEEKEDEEDTCFPATLSSFNERRTIMRNI